MSLPLVKHPTFTANIERIGDIKFRNFISQEHKTLMTANEMGDEDAVLDTIISIVDSCLFSDIDVNSLTTYELEYMFLQIYIKSVQSKVEIKYKCDGLIENIENDSISETNEDVDDDISEFDDIMLNYKQCDAEYTVAISIDNATIKYPNDFNELSLVVVNDDIDIKLQKPSLKTQRVLQKEYNDIIKKENEELEKDEPNENLLSVIKENKSLIDVKHIYDHIVYIHDKNIDDITNKEDIDIDEFFEWFDNLPLSAVDSIMKFVQCEPTLYYKHVIECPKCNTKKEIEFEGIKSFFG